MQKKLSFYFEAILMFLFFLPHFRSVTLAGERERKLLKEIVKKSKNPVKSRVIPQGMFLVSFKVKESVFFFL